MHRLLLALVVLLAVVVGGYLLFLKGDQVAPGPVSGVGAGSTAPQGTAESDQAGVLVDPSAGVARRSVDPSPDSGDASSPSGTLCRGRIVAAGGVPVAQAEVYARVSQRNRWGGGGGTLSDPVVTGPDGIFELALVGVEAPAPADEAEATAELVVLGKHRAYAPAVALRTAAWRDGAFDLGDVAVSTGGALLGSVTDLAGVAVAGAAIELESRDRGSMIRGSMGELALPEIMSDTSGFFRVGQLPPGRYRIQAVAIGHERERSDDFEIVEGRETSLEPLKLGPGYSIIGRVTDTQGQPVSRATVRVGRQSTRTDEAGDYAVHHLPPNQYSLTVRARGFLGWDVEEVDPALQSRWDVALLPGLMVSGQVTDESGKPLEMFAVRARRVRGLGEQDTRSQLEAMLQGAMGGAGAGTNVQITELRGQLEGLNLDLGQLQRGGRFRGDPEAHPDGQYELDGLSGEGVYVVQVKADDFLDGTSAEFELRQGASAPVINVVMPSGLMVRGLVRDGAGDPVANAKVELRPDSSSASGSGTNEMRMRMMREFAVRTVARGETDANGRFELGPAEPGTYVVRGEAEGFSRTQSAPVEMGATSVEDVVVTLDSKGRIVGRVLGIPDGRQDDVRVFVLPVRGSGRMRFGGGEKVDAEGRYSIAAAPGDFMVRAALQDDMRALTRQAMTVFGGETVTADVTVAAGRETAFDVQMVQSSVGTLVGTVTVNNELVSGYRVSAVEANPSTDSNNPLAALMRGRGRRGERTGADGSFRLNAVDSGLRILQVRSPAGAIVASIQVMVREGVELRQDVRVFLGSLKVAVQGLEGRELGRARLRLNRLGEDATVDVRPGAEETVRGLPLGTWEYRYTASGREDVTGTVDVQGELTELKLQAGAKRSG